jgi:hypothetical protein
MATLKWHVQHMPAQGCGGLSSLLCVASRCEHLQPLQQRAGHAACWPAPLVGCSGRSRSCADHQHSS